MRWQNGSHFVQTIFNWTKVWFSIVFFTKWLPFCNSILDANHLKFRPFKNWTKDDHSKTLKNRCFSPHIFEWSTPLKTRRFFVQFLNVIWKPGHFLFGFWMVFRCPVPWYWASEYSNGGLNTEPLTKWWSENQSTQPFSYRTHPETECLLYHGNRHLNSKPFHELPN